MIYKIYTESTGVGGGGGEDMRPIERSNQVAQDVAKIARNAIDCIIELERPVQQEYERGFIDGMQEQMRKTVKAEMEKNNG